MSTAPKRIDKQLQSIKLAEANKKEKEAKTAYETELERLTKQYTDELKVDTNKNKEQKLDEIKRLIGVDENTNTNLYKFKKEYTDAKKNIGTIKGEARTSLYDKTAYDAKRKLEEFGEKKYKPLSKGLAEKLGQDRFSKAQSKFNREKRQKINDDINNLKEEYKTADVGRRTAIDGEITNLIEDRKNYEGEGSVKVGRTMAKAANLSSEVFRPAARVFKQQFSVTDRTVLDETAKELDKVQQELDRINGLIDKPDFKGLVVKYQVVGTPAQIIGRTNEPFGSAVATAVATAVAADGTAVAADGTAVAADGTATGIADLTAEKAVAAADGSNETVFSTHLQAKFPFLYLNFEKMPSKTTGGKKMKGGAPPLDIKKTYYKETSPNFDILIGRSKTFRDTTLYGTAFKEVDQLIRQLNYLVAYKEELEKRKRADYLKGTSATPAPPVPDYDASIQNINRLIDEKKEEFTTKYTDYLKKLPPTLANYDSVIINTVNELKAFKTYFELAGKPANLKFYSNDTSDVLSDVDSLGKKIEPLNKVITTPPGNIDLTGSILYLYSDTIKKAFVEKMKFTKANVTLMRIIEPVPFFIKDMKSLTEAITSELKASLPESKKKDLEAQEKAKRDAEGSGVNPEEMLTNPELKVYSRVFPHPFVNGKGYRIGNWHVIVDTSKLPFSGIDEVNHFLYNLFDYVNYEGTPKTSKEMERAITDFYKFHQTELPAYNPIRYPDEEEQKFKKMQKEMLDKENAKMQANLRRLRNELAGFGYGTEEYKKNKELRDTLSTEIEKKFVDASGKPKTKEENQKILAAYAEAIGDEDLKLSGEKPIFDPTEWKSDGSRFPPTAPTGKKGGKRKSTNGSIKNRKWRKGKKNNKTKRC